MAILICILSVLISIGSIIENQKNIKRLKNIEKRLDKLFENKL